MAWRSRAARSTAINPQELERLRSTCAELIGIEPDELEDGTDFFEDLSIDGDDLAEVFVALEDAFGVSLEDGFERVHTFEDLAALVEDALTL